METATDLLLEMLKITGNRTKYKPLATYLLE